MQIQRLALKNFKCFKEVDVSFSKITLLTGENSSGKSSLIYGMLAPLQSVNLHGNSFPLQLTLNGELVNMGGFEEVSFNHNLKNYLGIDLTISSYEDIHEFNTFWYFDAVSKAPKLNHLKITQPTGNVIEIKQKEDEDLFSAFNNYGFRDISNSLYVALMGGFNFISSFRMNPERTYYQSINNKVDKSGVGFIDQILEWNDNKSKELYELASILKDLRILYEIKPYRLSGGRFEIKVKVKSKSKWESLADVGFGISQFLPIIVADLQLWEDDSTLIMSQPEIHLHPSVQADLGNYLVKQVKERNKNYIIETHSEYLLNRIRLLIVNREIQPEDVAVYYFENSIKDGSVAHRIEFTKQGQILNAPKGFFETYMIDTMDIALNA